MTRYILLIHGNVKSAPTPQEWASFFEAASQGGHFRGGSEIGTREVIGNTEGVEASDHIVGFMRFDSEGKGAVLELLERHPTVVHGGSVELCQLPES